MTCALIGSTGFVGGTLLRHERFDATYHSANIHEIAGRTFDLIVCAGAPAAKWKANSNPTEDRAGIDRLVDALSQARASRVVLISTVDVFRDPVGVDESTPTPEAGLHPYGANRRMLEECVARTFATTIIRLPGLYGPGLKKNIIYDLLNNNELAKIDSRGVFQFYSLDRLWADVEIVLRSGLDLVHLVTEPVSVEAVALDGFSKVFENRLGGEPAHYDVRTKHSDLFGRVGVYIQDGAEVLASIRSFVASTRDSLR